MMASLPICNSRLPATTPPTTICRCNRQYVKGRSRPLKPIRAENLSGSQEQAPSQEQAKDPEDTLWQEIEREDQQAAEVINGKAPVFDLFPPPPPRLTAREQKQRAFKLSRRPLRRYQDVDRVNASSRRQAGAEREPVAAALPAVELKPVDLRPTLPLPPICNLPRSSGADREDSLKRVSSVSEHYKPLESGEGIGSYASKVAAAGLGPLPNPRLVVEYHPLVAKARMDRNVAAGYDPNVEWGSESILAGQNIADLGDDADEEEEELELRGGSREERPSSSATVDDVDLPEFGFEESDEVDWGADFVDDEEETLQDEFGRVLDETIEQRLGEDPAEEDTEGFGVWDGTDEEDGLGDSRGRSKQSGQSAEQADEVEDLDSAILKWQKLSSMRSTEGP